jgi:GT2 family glycosyltransferase
MAVGPGSPALSVIVPCLGQAEELEMCLQALSRQTTGSFEIVVVDSAWDQAVEAAAARFPRVRLVRSRARLSAGAARNYGVRHASALWLGFLDADCVPAADWVKQACRSLESGGRLFGGPVLDQLPNHPVAWSDNRLQFADFQAGRPAGLGSYFPGCNMCIGRQDFDEAGGFEEEHLCGEDVILSSHMAARYPGGLVYNAQLLVHHRGRVRGRDFLEHQRLLGYRRSHSGLRMNAGYERLARHRLLAGLVMLRRLGYIGLRTVQYDPPGLARLALFFPWLLVGLAAWTAGFYDGYRPAREGR